MENITVLRRRNLLWLLQQYVRSQVEEGAAPKGLEQAFAAQVQISPSLLSQVKSSRPIGDKLARQVEAACKQPAGWLDLEHAQDHGPSPAEERFIDLARAAWRASNAAGKRSLTRLVAEAQAVPAARKAGG